MRLKVCRAETDWFKEGGQKDDWTTAGLRFTVWKSGSDVKEQNGSQTPGKADRGVNPGLPY